MKIYTRRGDDGTTQVGGGLRVPKDDPQVEMEGVLDELNAALGLAASLLQQDSELLSLATELRELQRSLFRLGGDISGYNRDSSPLVDEGMTVALENRMDELTELLPELTRFVLPGCSPASAAVHMARTVARRLEVHMVRVQKQSLADDNAPHPVQPADLMFVNRLSDYLFVLARFVCYKQGLEEVVV